MKNHVINKRHIIEAWISEPEAPKKTGYYDSPGHGWQVVLNLSHDSYARINKSSKQECIEFIDKLKFINV